MLEVDFEGVPTMEQILKVCATVERDRNIQPTAIRLEGRSLRAWLGPAAGGRLNGVPVSELLAYPGRADGAWEVVFEGGYVAFYPGSGAHVLEGRAFTVTL